MGVLTELLALMRVSRQLLAKDFVLFAFNFVLFNFWVLNISAFQNLGNSQLIVATSNKQSSWMLLIRFQNIFRMYPCAQCLGSPVRISGLCHISKISWRELISRILFPYFLPNPNAVMIGRLTTLSNWSEVCTSRPLISFLSALLIDHPHARFMRIAMCKMR